MRPILSYLIVCAFAMMTSAAFSQQKGKAEDLYQEGLMQMEGRGNYKKALDIFGQILKSYPTNRPVSAKAQFQIGACYEKLGKSEAQKAYERVIKDFSDQREVAAEARARLAALLQPALAMPASSVLTRRITEDANVDVLGTPSSDGRFLSTTDWSTGDAVLVEVATGQKRPVTNKGGWQESSEFAQFPAISPDGKRIAYSWFNKDNRFDIRVINTDGSSSRVLFSSEELTQSWPTAWMPDGNSILVFINRSDRTRQIALLSITDGSVRILKKLPVGSNTYRASISPDGRYVVYNAPGKSGFPESDIFLLAVEDGHEVPLVQRSSSDDSPLWAPDGQSVVFMSDRTDAVSLWRIRVVGGKPQGPEELLRAGIGTLYPIGISANGSFFYSLTTGMVDVYLATLDFSTGKVTANPAPISHRLAGGRSGPHWSPDGKYLVYTSHRDPYSSRFLKLAIYSTETGLERELPLNLQRINVRPRWSPNAREILVTAKDSEGRLGFYRVDARTGESTLIVSARDGVDLRWGRWSPDGQSVFFVRFHFKTQVNTVVQRSLQSGEEKELGRYHMPEYVVGFDLSPDGQQFLLNFLDQSTRRGMFKLFPIAGGEARDLYRTEPSLRPLAVSPFWTPDGKNILFMQHPGLPSDPELAPPEVWRLSVETGKAEKLGLSIQGLSQLTVHPDGKQVAFSSGESKNEIWVMENLLPKEEN